MSITKEIFLINILKESILVNSFKGSGMSGLCQLQQVKKVKNIISKKQKPFDAEGYIDEIAGNKSATSGISSDLYRYHD